MNYRHSFHAGNFADILKHALLLWLVEARQSEGPLTVIDTHAGAGLYDLTGDGARSREAEAGVQRLAVSEDRPPLIESLATEVTAINPDGGVGLYPGSPLLVARRLRQGDRYLGFEMNPPVLALLEQALVAWPSARAQGGDGYDQAVSAARAIKGPLVLIDPPFERPDDYVRSAETGAAIVRADPMATVAVWTPLKDLETFDGFIRRIEAAKVGPVLVAEARLRPLLNPMKMNGCALVIINPPEGAEAAARMVCDWVATVLGGEGAKAAVWQV